MTAKTKTLKIHGCTECYYCDKTYVGQGDYSYRCDKADRIIVYKAESPAQVPNKGFPDWCPL